MANLKGESLGGLRKGGTASPSVVGHNEQRPSPQTEPGAENRIDP